MVPLVSGEPCTVAVRVTSSPRRPSTAQGATMVRTAAWPAPSRARRRSCTEGRGSNRDFYRPWSGPVRPHSSASVHLVPRRSSARLSRSRQAAAASATDAPHGVDRARSKPTSPGISTEHLLVKVSLARPQRARTPWHHLNQGINGSNSAHSLRRSPRRQQCESLAIGCGDAHLPMS